MFMGLSYLQVGAGVITPKHNYRLPSPADLGSVPSEAFKVSSSPTYSPHLQKNALSFKAEDLSRMHFVDRCNLYPCILVFQLTVM